MAYEQVSNASRGLDVAQQRDDPAANRLIQRRRRLVEHNELGFADERPRDGNPLLLAARKLSRKPRLVGRPQSYECQNLVDLLLDLGAATPFHQVAWLAHRRTRPETWIQRCVRMLEHHLHPTPKSFGADQVFEPPAVKPDLPGRRRLQADDHPTKRCLAAPRLSDEGDRLSPIDVEVHSAQRRDGLGPLAVDLVQPSYLKKWQRDPLCSENKLKCGPHRRDTAVEIRCRPHKREDSDERNDTRSGRS